MITHDSRSPRRLPRHACSTPECSGKVITGSKCNHCTKQADVVRGTSSARGYDTTHRRLRLLAFQRDNWTCVDCGWRPRCVIECEELGIDLPPTAIILDELRQAKHRGERYFHGEHDTPFQQRPDLRTDLENYRTRCNVCHSRKTLEEMR